MNPDATIFLHGWGMSKAAWRPVVEVLAVDGSADMQELPGHGQRAGEPEPDRAHWVEELARQAGRGTWIGWSLGGQLALQLALDYPGQVRRLVLIGAAASFVVRSGWPWGSAKEELDDFVRSVARSPAEALRQFNRWQVAGSERARSGLAELDREAERWPASKAGLLHGLQLLRELDLRERLGQLSIPVLAIAGDQDRVVPAEAVRETAARIPGAQFEAIPGAGHAAIVTHPGEVAAAMRPFLARAEAA